MLATAEGVAEQPPGCTLRPAAASARDERPDEGPALTGGGLQNFPVPGACLEVGRGVTFRSTAVLTRKHLHCFIALRPGACTRCRGRRRPRAAAPGHGGCAASIDPITYGAGDYYARGRPGRREAVRAAAAARDALVVQGLQWGEGIRSPASLAPPAADVTGHEIEGALALMETMSVERLTELDDQLTDRYTDALIEVINAIAEHRAWLAGHIHGEDGCRLPGQAAHRHRLGRGTPSFRAPSTCWWALTLHAVRGRSRTAFVPRPKFR